ncbi:transglutaminase domain-containing protein [Paenibacillus albus]|nr:transglutaminase domain-containing protein [Paenibacillus albus]
MRIIRSLCLMVLALMAGAVSLPVGQSTVAEAAAGQATDCGKTWYNASMTVTPSGMITVKGSAEPIYLKDPSKEGIYKLKEAAAKGFQAYVGLSLKIAGVSYYDIGNHQIIKAGGNVKYTAIPAKVKACVDQAVFNHNVNTWVTEAKKLKTPLLRLAYLFTEIDKHVEYDWDLYIGTGGFAASHTGFGAIVNGLGVCDGYAEALKILLDKVGIPNRLIEGTARGEGHMWNLVKLDGLSYHVDPTWGDNYGNAFHYFLLPDQDMQRDHKWSGKTYATSDKYYFLSRDSIDAFGVNFLDGTFYTGGGTIDKMRLDHSGSTQISPKGDYVFRYQQVYNNQIYYLTLDGVKRMDMDGGNAQLLTDTHGATNDFYVFNGKVYYTSFILYPDQPYSFELYQCNLDGSGLKLVHQFTDEEHDFDGFTVVHVGSHDALYYYTNDKKMTELDKI